MNRNTALSTQAVRHSFDDVPTQDAAYTLHRFVLEQAACRAAAPQVLLGRPVPAVLLLKEPGRLVDTASSCFSINRTVLRICLQAPLAFEAVSAERYARLARRSESEPCLHCDQRQMEQALANSADSLWESYELTEAAVLKTTAPLRDFRTLVRMGVAPRLGWAVGVARHELLRLAVSAEQLGADLVVWPGCGSLRPLVVLGGSAAPGSATSSSSAGSSAGPGSDSDSP
jgi:hypothetical protein